LNVDDPVSPVSSGLFCPLRVAMLEPGKEVLPAAVWLPQPAAIGTRSSRTKRETADKRRRYIVIDIPRR